ncbi:uncharacterized protein LOC106138449 [Amyelois transitella]|uniref:uncharacterized protein LOC106138449 n=1 Tax=Amyelois transitella TaxID=680683 RepID=UPI00298F9F1E|nr:uncharacterized protein LOC106138449 [Amyelois transitella]
MKILLCLCLLGVVGLSLGDTKTYPRGCIYILGTCVKECDEGTHAYSLGCGNKVPEPTCEEPNPVVEKGLLCDYSACYCDPPTVRDTKNNVCVPLDKCPE